MGTQPRNQLVENISYKIKNKYIIILNDHEKSIALKAYPGWSVVGLVPTFSDLLTVGETIALRKNKAKIYIWNNKSVTPIGHIGYDGFQQCECGIYVWTGKRLKELEGDALNQYIEENYQHLDNLLDETSEYRLVDTLPKFLV